MKNTLIAFCVALALALPSYAENGGGAIDLAAASKTTFKLQGLLEQASMTKEEAKEDNMEETASEETMADNLDIEAVAQEIDLSVEDSSQEEVESLSLSDMKSRILAKRAAKQESATPKTGVQNLAKSGPESNLIIITVVSMLGVFALRRKA